MDLIATAPAGLSKQRICQALGQPRHRCYPDRRRRRAGCWESVDTFRPGLDGFYAFPASAISSTPADIRDSPAHWARANFSPKKNQPDSAIRK